MDSKGKIKKAQTNPMGKGMGGQGHGHKIESARDFKKTLNRLISYFGPDIYIIIIAAVCILASVGLKTLGPAVIGSAIKNYLELSQDMTGFVRQMFLLLGLYSSSWIIDVLSGVLMVRLANNIVFRLRNDAFSHVQKLSMSFFDKKGLGDIISRLTNDIEMIYNVMSNSFKNILNGVFSILGVLIAMFVLNYKLSFIIIAIVPVMAFFTVIIGKRVRSAFRKSQKQVGLLSANIEESISGIKAIKCFNKEHDEFVKFENLNNKAKKIGIKAGFTSFTLMPLIQFMSALSLAVIVCAGGISIVKYPGVFSIGLLTSFILYTQRFFEPLRQLSNVYNVLQSAIAGAERVFEILDTEPGITNKKDVIILDDLTGNVEFRNVTFGYNKADPVLDKINLKVDKGEVIAIVGPTGAGKTTLVNLLSRFYDVNTGSIFIDGNDIRDIDVNSLRKQMGVVLQEPFFFAASIKENILYGNSSASEEDILNAAKLSNADCFITRLPHGYDTILSERGSNLSQGERQLLAIARVILSNPKILIMDEATSNIDSLTEVNIQKGLLELMKERTCFIIAHRLSTIKNADKVLVIHNHRIIETGTHTELMKKEGFYARLYSMQLKKEEITEEEID